MKTTCAMVFVLWLVCNAGCDVKARIAINSTEQETDQYAEHYKHGDDMFYKGTFVIRETAGSVMNRLANEDPSLRVYRVLDTDVEFQTEVVGSELTHDKILALQRQGFRIIIG